MILRGIHFYGPPCVFAHFRSKNTPLLGTSWSGLGVSGRVFGVSEWFFWGFLVFVRCRFVLLFLSFIVSSLWRFAVTFVVFVSCFFFLLLLFFAPSWVPKPIPNQ